MGTAGITGLRKHSYNISPCLVLSPFHKAWVWILLRASTYGWLALKRGTDTGYGQCERKQTNRNGIHVKQPSTDVAMRRTHISTVKDCALLSEEWQQIRGEGIHVGPSMAES